MVGIVEWYNFLRVLFVPNLEVCQISQNRQQRTVWLLFVKVKLTTDGFQRISKWHLKEMQNLGSDCSCFDTGNGHRTVSTPNVASNANVDHLWFLPRLKIPKVSLLQSNVRMDILVVLWQCSNWGAPYYVWCFWQCTSDYVWCLNSSFYAPCWCSSPASHIVHAGEAILVKNLDHAIRYWLQWILISCWEISISDQLHCEASCSSAGNLLLLPSFWIT